MKFLALKATTRMYGCLNRFRSEQYKNTFRTTDQLLMQSSEGSWVKKEQLPLIIVVS